MQYSRSWAAESPEEATAALASSHAGVRVTSSSSRPFRLTAWESGDAQLALSALHWTAAAQAHADADRYYTVCDVYEGAVTIAADSTVLDGEHLRALPLGALDASWTAPHRVRTVRVEQAVVDAFAQQQFGLPGLTVEFTGGGPLSPAHDALWRAVERHVREDVIAHPEHLHNDLIWDAARHHLIATLLAVFPNSTLDLAPAGERALPASVRRATAYMEEHLAEAISLADIAAAARLSPRGVLSAFRRTLQVTPTQHLRALRLDAARSELLRAERADGHTVAAIGRRWGFAHAARFAAHYRERFGENPSETMRR